MSVIGRLVKTHFKERRNYPCEQCDQVELEQPDLLKISESRDICIQPSSLF